MVSQKTVKDALQELCDSHLDDATDVTWDLYRLDDFDKLELKVRLALFAESVTVDENGEAQIISQAGDKEARRRNTLIKHVSQKIWDQKKHTKNCLRMSIVYVALVKDAPQGTSPTNATNYMVRPLFRTMKCLCPYTKSSEGKCMVFVDEFGWVYQSWAKFMANTLYPATMIVAPERGVFMRNNFGTVLLMHFQAPLTADEIERREWQNLGMTVTGLGSTAVLVGAAFFPVTAPIVWGAAIVGGLVATITGAQSVSELVRRHKHEQDISLGDEEARAHWLAISGTLLSFGAAGASSVVRGAATAGTVSKSVITVSNTVCFSSMVVNGVAVGNGIYTAALGDRKVTTSEILQLSVSLFLFTHSVYNYKAAQTVIKETQVQHLSDYKQTLSKNGQRNFQKKLNARTARTGSSTQAMGDTIRNLNSADHYNNNFRGTASFQSTASLLEDTAMQQKLMSTMKLTVDILPEIWPELLEVYYFIKEANGEAYWKVLTGMAKLILNRVLNRSLTLPNVIKDLFVVIRRDAAKKNVSIDCILSNYRGTYETIPAVARQHYEDLELKVGPLKCYKCNGKKFL